MRLEFGPMQRSEPQEISADYRVIGERPRKSREPIFAPGGLVRLIELLVSIVILVGLAHVIGPIVRWLFAQVGL